MSRFAKDPEERFRELVGAFAPVAPALAPSALQRVIDTSRPDNVVDNLAAEVAKHSQLTQAAAQPLVEAAVQGQPAQTQANAVSQAATAAVSVQASVKMSDPVMLAPGLRSAGAGILALITLLCALNIDSVATAKVVSGTAVVSQAVVAVLALIGMLVLVMGYKNVTIQASPPAGGGA